MHPPDWFHVVEFISSGLGACSSIDADQYNPLIGRNVASDVHCLSPASHPDIRPPRSIQLYGLKPLTTK